MGRLILAPMEGLADCVLRDALTRIGGFDEAVSEFVRVSGSLLPERTFRRFCPELANGEVWNVADYVRIRAETGCEDVMLGRGAVADPWLAQRIVTHLEGREWTPPEGGEWAALLPHLVHFWESVHARVEARYVHGRLKLWLNALRRAYPEAEALYQAVRPLPTAAAVESVLRQASGRSGGAGAAMQR